MHLLLMNACGTILHAFRDETFSHQGPQMVGAHRSSHTCDADIWWKHHIRDVTWAMFTPNVYVTNVTAPMSLNQSCTLRTVVMS